MARLTLPLTAWSSALIAALVGFGGTVAIVVQAMRSLGASVDQIGSAVTALCLGIAIFGAALSLRLRMPVILAWSTPGAAFLAAAPTGISWPAMIGCFLSAALLTILFGLVPALERLVRRIPPTIASAMLAGVILPFCLELFRIAGIDPLLAVPLLSTFVAARSRVPLYALPLVLAAGVAITLLRGDVVELPAGRMFGTLQLAAPLFDLPLLLSLGLPLFLVTLISQNLPGLIILRASGYEPRASSLLVGTGLASLLAAPFGGHALNLAAITAAICTSDDAHADRSKRWTVGIIYAGIYLLLALFSPLLVRFFLALPPPVIGALTGIALIPTFISSCEAMIGRGEDRDPAILTFLATASGLTLFGLGSVLWGLAAGLGASALSAFRQAHSRSGAKLGRVKSSRSTD